MNRCFIRSPRAKDWPQISKLLVASFPNALVSQFGLNFATLYYRHLAEGPCARILGAFDRAGELAGVVIGTVDRKRTRQLPFALILRLLLAANYRLFSRSFFLWLANSQRTETKTAAVATAGPQAELLAIAVDSRFRGQEVASRLLSRIEAFFRGKNLPQPYVILTEKTNHAANSFYEKTGARFIGTNLHHGREINVWHKDPAEAVSSAPPERESIANPTPAPFARTASR